MTFTHAMPEDLLWRNNKHCENARQWCEFLVREHGFEYTTLIGLIGRGTKTHVFHAVARREGDVTRVAFLMSLCGSMHYTSQLSVLGESDAPACAKCGKRLAQAK